MEIEYKTNFSVQEANHTYSMVAVSRIRPEESVLVCWHNRSSIYLHPERSNAWDNHLQGLQQSHCH